MLSADAASLPVGIFSVAGTTWSENAITSNTAPAAGATPLATKTVTGTTGTWYEFDVTNYLKQQKAAGATAVAFALKATVTSEGFVGFNSDEASEQPAAARGDVRVRPDADADAGGADPRERPDGPGHRSVHRQRDDRPGRPGHSSASARTPAPASGASRLRWTGSSSGPRARSRSPSPATTPVITAVDPAARRPHARRHAL